MILEMSFPSLSRGGKGFEAPPTRAGHHTCSQRIRQLRRRKGDADFTVGRVDERVLDCRHVIVVVIIGVGLNSGRLFVVLAHDALVVGKRVGCVVPVADIALGRLNLSLFGNDAGILALVAINSSTAGIGGDGRRCRPTLSARLVAGDARRRSSNSTRHRLGTSDGSCWYWFCRTMLSHGNNLVCHSGRLLASLCRLTMLDRRHSLAMNSSLLRGW